MPQNKAKFLCDCSLLQGINQTGYLFGKEKKERTCVCLTKIMGSSHESPGKLKYYA